MSDYDAPSVYRVSMVKAQKPYCCVECGRDIPVGEQYEYVFGVWCGDTNSFRTCAHCAAARTAMKEATGCRRWDHYNLYGEMVDYASNADWSDGGKKFRLLRLVLGIKRKWTGPWRYGVDVAPMNGASDGVGLDTENAESEG